MNNSAEVRSDECGLKTPHFAGIPTDAELGHLLVTRQPINLCKASKAVANFRAALNPAKKIIIPQGGQSWILILLGITNAGNSWRAIHRFNCDTSRPYVLNPTPKPVKGKPTPKPDTGSVLQGLPDIASATVGDKETLPATRFCWRRMLALIT
jgi:hypothetical protein